MPAQGDKVRAVGVARGAFEGYGVKLSTGMLPPAGPMTDPRMDDK
jgi:hypothetical protein